MAGTSAGKGFLPALVNPGTQYGAPVVTAPSFMGKLANFWGAPSFAAGYRNIQNDAAARAQLQYELDQKAKLEAQQGGLYSSLDPRLADRGMIKPEDMAKVLPFYGNKDYGAAMQDVNNGQMPQSYGLAPAAQVQQLGGDINSRIARNADYQTYLNQRNPAFAAGQQQAQAAPVTSLPRFTGGSLGRGIRASFGTPGGNVQMQQDPSLQQPLQGGLAQQQVDPQNISPFYQGSLTPEQLNPLYTAGATNTEKGQALAQKTQNDAGELKAKNRIINATIAGQGGYGKTPAGMTMAELLAQQAPDTQANYFNRVGGRLGAPGDKILKDLDALKTQYENNGESDGWFGIGSHPTDVGTRGRIATQYNALASRYGMPPIDAVAKPVNAPTYAQNNTQTAVSGSAQKQANAYLQKLGVGR